MWVRLSFDIALLWSVVAATFWLVSTLDNPWPHEVLLWVAVVFSTYERIDFRIREGSEGTDDETFEDGA
jgi:hypothetical protein